MSRPWMPLYVADYLADTGHLSTLEHGAYLLLIMHYWATGGLPADDKRLASIARASLEQWSDMRATLAEFFEPDWKHARIDEELESAAKAYERRAAAGRAGGKAKAQSASNATAKLKQSHSQPQDKKIEADASIKRERAKPSSDFDAWYQHYPHKVQRGAAERAFLKARKLASLEILIAGVHRYRETKPDDRQWQNPATWLNGKGWLDQPAPIPRATDPPKPRNAGELARLQLKAMNDAPDNQARHIDAIDTSANPPIPGFARRIAVASGR